MSKKTYNQENYINGSYGEAWIDEEYLASLNQASATVALSYEDIKTPRKLGKGKKLIEIEGTAEITIGKVSSVGLRHMNKKLQEGKQPVVNIMMKLDDPDALGAERVMLKNCTFNELTLFDFESGATGEEKLSINFESYEIYDYIQ